MFFRKLATYLVCLWGLVGVTAHAQSEARIRAVVPSIDDIESDLKWLIELNSDPNLRKQWKTLKEDVLNAMTQGVDLSKPVCVDVIVRKDDLAYEYRIPILSLEGADGFLPGLTGIGFKVKEITKGTYYQFAEKGQAPYYLRYDRSYAWISRSEIPANPPEATQDLKGLLSLERDVVAHLKNDAAGLAARRQDFKGMRKQFEALIKQRRNEDPTGFELRKIAATHQLDELERYIVEAEELLISWNTSTAAPAAFGRGEISLTALPDTDLLKSIEEIASKPSLFSHVVMHGDAVAQLRVNFALDSMRVAHAKKFYRAVRPALEAEIGRLTGMNESQKTAMKQATNKFVDMLDTGLSLGVVDMFVDGFAAQPGKNAMVCAIRAADGTVADEIVKLLPQMDADWKIKPAVAKHGGVTIHEVTVAKASLAAFQKIFANESVLYVGTTKDAVWGAAGTDAMKHLEAAIDQAAQPAPEQADPVVVSYQFQLDQLVNMMDLIQKVAPQKSSAAPKDPKQAKEQRQREKDLERFRKLAQDAMGSCNSLMHGELKKTGNKIEGHLELSECILKFIGAMIADGVKVLQ